MVVYVDDMYRYPMGQFGRMKMSHMIADTEDELHAMAKKIGVARKWYQGDHYDIAISKRDLALEHGAKPITLRECAIMTANRRWFGTLGTPKKCIALSRLRMKQEAIARDLIGEQLWRSR